MATITAEFLTVIGAPSIAAVTGLGLSLRAAKRAAVKALRASGVRGSIFLKHGGACVSMYDGARWSDSYGAEFLSSAHGITA